MRTASFWSYGGPGRVAISRSVPLGFRTLPRYGPLSPGGWWSRGLPWPQYIYLYGKQLALLDPRDVHAALVKLAAEAAEPVLLCWEPPGRNCHRRLVAAWLESELGVAVPEYDARRTTP